MKRALKQFSVAACAILSLALTSSHAFAQCAMCRAAAAAAGNEASSSLNLAILVLLVPPVIMFCAIFIIAYRLRAAQGEPPKEERPNRAWPEKPKVGTSLKGGRISPGGATYQ